MFDRIARRYDLMNALMSFGLHRYWRRRAIQSLLSRGGRDFLDIGCGTGDIAITLARKDSAARVTGIDPSPDMLAVAAVKIEKAGLGGGVVCIGGDATAMSFPDASFDGIVSAFCIRNITNRAAAFREMRRVLRPGGTLAILELTAPLNPVMKVIHTLYTRRIIPLMGRLVSDGQAYRYLAESIDHFPPAAEIARELVEAGFENAIPIPLSGGLVTLFTGQQSYCFAAPAYANSVPLAQFIPAVCPDASVILDHPSQLLAQLKAHHIDAALMPVADLFANPGLEMIPGVGICADGLVRSVLLKCNRPMGEVHTVKLDPASRTSNALARILLKRHWKRDIRIVSGNAEADAEVVIGDRALCAPPAPAGDYDLATAWKQMTGLPFVFAVWVFPKDHSHPDILKDMVMKARKAGLDALPAITHEQAVKLGLSEETCREYFTHCIQYDIGPRELEALRLFKRLMHVGRSS